MSVVASDEVPCWRTKTAKKQDEEPTKMSDSEGTQKEPKTANCKPMASASLHQAPSVLSEAVQWHVKYNGTWRCIQFRSGDWRAVCGSKAAYPLHERTCHACGYVLPAGLARSCWLAMLAGKCITATDHARSKDGRSTGMSAAQNGSDIGSEDTSPVHLKLRIAIG